MESGNTPWITVIPAGPVPTADLPGEDLSALLAELTRVGRRLADEHPGERIEVVAHGPGGGCGSGAHFHFTHEGWICTDEGAGGGGDAGECVAARRVVRPRRARRRRPAS